MRAQTSLVAAWFTVQELAQVDPTVVTRGAFGSTVEAALNVKDWEQYDNAAKGGAQSNAVAYLEDGLQRLMALMCASLNAQHFLMAALYGRTHALQVHDLQSAVAYQANLHAQASAAYDVLTERLMAYYPVLESSTDGAAKVMH
jgi:hypothetical protein